MPQPDRKPTLPPGRAVGDEDPDASPMDDVPAGRQLKKPMDVVELEGDRARTAGRPPLRDR